jgi:hypothetical protein
MQPAARWEGATDRAAKGLQTATDYREGDSKISLPVLRNSAEHASHESLDLSPVFSAFGALTRLILIAVKQPDYNHSLEIARIHKCSCGSTARLPIR